MWNMSPVMVKQVLRSLSLSFQKKFCGHQPSFDMIPTIELHFVVFKDYILYTVSWQKKDWLGWCQPSLLLVWHWQRPFKRPFWRDAAHFDCNYIVINHSPDICTPGACGNILMFSNSLTLILSMYSGVFWLAMLDGEMWSLKSGP